MEGKMSGFDVKTLLEIPVTNLEKRIEELKKDIMERVRLRDTVVNDLEWERKKMDEELDQFRGYLVSHNEIPFKMKKTELQHSISMEKVNCFRDLIMLREKLRYAIEKYNIEKNKKRLVNGRG